jgi:hypothetical protein
LEAKAEEEAQEERGTTRRPSSILTAFLPLLRPIGALIAWPTDRAVTGIQSISVAVAIPSHQDSRGPDAMQGPLSPDEPRGITSPLAILNLTSSTVVVAVDRDRNSQLAVKWAVDYLLSGASHILLLHVVNHSCTVSRMLPCCLPGLPLTQQQ